AAYGDYRLLEGRPSLLDRVEGLVPAQDGLADRLETVAQQVSWGLSRLAQTDQRMADAGIIVNPETGLVEITAVHRIDQRIGEVSITADAALAELSLKASYAEVNQAITEALL
ncbi:hypothetical protein, partial [Roseivivax isoporae]|uniref:hypothetical protein n=1 Tax=Roseivivax isoporae TaxID=591206 RepID=UPI0005C1A94F